MVFVPLLHPGLMDGCLCWDNLSVEFFVLAMEKVALISYLLCLLGGDSSAPLPCAVSRSCSHSGIIQDPTTENKSFFFFFSTKIYSLATKLCCFTVCIFKELQMNLRDVLQCIIMALSLKPSLLQ